MPLEATLTLNFIFFLCLLSALFCNRWLLNHYQTWGVQNNETAGIERWSAVTKPAVGGLGFFIIFLLSLLCAFFFAGEQMNTQFIGLVMACLVGFWLGWIDDQQNISPFFKFGGQFLAAHLLFFSGIIIEINQIWFVNYSITIIWIVGIMNSINMLDNMDGIASMSSLFIILNCLLAAFLQGEAGIFSICMIGIAAAMWGFLRYNWSPAKMYMGDSGSMFLGVFLAAMSILFLWQNKAQNTHEFFQIRQFVLPLIAFLIPIIDTSTVTIRRLARGQSPFVGGRDHTTHQLARWLRSDLKVAIVFLLISLLALCLNFFLFLQIDNWQWQFTLIAWVFFGLIFSAFQLLYFLKKEEIHP